LIFGYFVSRQSNSPAATERNDVVIFHPIQPKPLRRFLHAFVPVPRSLFAFGAADGAVVFIFPIMLTVLSEHGIGDKRNDH
jgi:hypothetical protein